jgi:hypothetical protein
MTINETDEMIEHLLANCNAAMAAAAALMHSEEGTVIEHMVGARILSSPVGE